MSFILFPVAQSMAVGRLSNRQNSTRHLEKMENEGTQMKTTELTKIYTGSTDQMAAKQHWSHRSQAGGSDLGMSALAQLLQGKKIAIEDKSPVDDAVDVTPRKACVVGP